MSLLRLLPAAIVAGLAATGSSSATPPSVPEPSPTPRAPAGTAAASLRLVELTGDDLPDQLRVDASGRLAVAINRGGGLFEEVVQELPSTPVRSTLTGDLDGDGQLDLYLVSPGENVALRGLGDGRFVDDTAALGLADGGRGLSAEWMELDGVDPAEFVVHNAGGDVIFWADGTRWRRDGATPERRPEADTGALAGLLAMLTGAAADPTVLGGGVEVELAFDVAGRPRVTFRTPRDGPDGPSSGSPDGPAGGDGPRAAPLPGGHASDPAAPAGSPGSAPGSGPSAPSPPAPGSGAPPTPGPGLGDGGLGRDETAGIPAPPVQSFGLTPEQEQILGHMSIVFLDDGFGNMLETIRIEGVNVQIVNGLGATNGFPSNPNSVNPAQTQVNGLGNLIVGYNEPGATPDRTGSHGLVLGRQQDYSSFGGVMAGADNTVTAPYASIFGGQNNAATANYAAVNGGSGNIAAGDFSTVGGGQANKTSEWWATVNGGRSNEASNFYATVSGGRGNIASGNHATVSGGEDNTSSSNASSVGGGFSNTASNKWSSVSGGQLNQATGEGSSVTGGDDNIAQGDRSSVCGGKDNLASGLMAAVLGGSDNEAQGERSCVSGGDLNLAAAFLSSVNGGQNCQAQASSSTVSGGLNRSAPASFNWVGGSLLENN